MNGYFKSTDYITSYCYRGLLRNESDHPQFAVGDDQKIAAAARRIEEFETAEPLVKLLQLVAVVLDALKFAPQIVEKRAA